MSFEKNFPRLDRPLCIFSNKTFAFPDLIHMSRVLILRQGVRVLPEPSSGVRILSGGRNLVLQGVARNSSGNYTCSAFNLEGNATSNALPLRVKCEWITGLFVENLIIKFFPNFVL